MTLCPPSVSSWQPMEPDYNILVDALNTIATGPITIEAAQVLAQGALDHFFHTSPKG
jgi:hypothetical protein